MSVRARFFDDYRLSRIEEEADRLSLQSDISCSLDVVSSSICPPAAFTAQRSASADGTLQSTADNDDDDDDNFVDDELPPPPPQLASIDLETTKMTHEKLLESSLSSSGGELAALASAADMELSAAAARALHFMQAKYDSLGKVKINKPTSGNGPVVSPTTPSSSTATPTNCRLQPSTSTSSGIGMAPSSRLSCPPPPTELSNFCKNISGGTSQEEVGLRLQTGCTCSSAHCLDRSCHHISERHAAACGHHDEHVTCLRYPHHTCGVDTDCGSLLIQSGRTAGLCSPTSPSGSGPGLVGSRPAHYGLGQQSTQMQQKQPQQQQVLRQCVGETAASSQCHHAHGLQPPTSANGAAAVTATVRRALPLTTAELFQVDLFYRSYKTVVQVSTCTATMYISSSHSNRSHHHQQHNYAGDRQVSLSATDWKPVAVGIPVAVLDQRHQPGRLNIVLAERGTGFELWRQVLDRTDQYVAASLNDEPVFHVVNCSTEGDSQRHASNGGRRIGLHFDDPLAATEFHRQLLRLADHDRLTLTCGGRHGKSKKNLKGIIVFSFTWRQHLR
jgi:hypothetical protein